MHKRMPPVFESTPALKPTVFVLQPDAVRAYVSEITFTRGRDVYRNQQVLELDVCRGSASDWVLHGKVQGSLRTPYEVTVQLELSASGKLSFFESECSCPVGEDCKHGVALALKAAYKSAPPRVPPPPPASTPTSGTSLKVLEAKKAEVERIIAQLYQQQQPKNQQQQELAKLGQWLDLFDDTATGADGMASPDSFSTQEHLVYLLIPVTKEQRQVLHLGYGLSSRLRSGKWAKVKVPRYLHPHTTPARDLEVIRLIGTLSPQTNRWGALEHGPISGESGRLALQLAAATGQLYAANANHVPGHAVQLGQTRPLRWQWSELPLRAQALDEPRWKLDFLAPAPDHPERWFANTPPLYLDANSGECGPLETPGISSQHLGLLLQAPPIPQSAFTSRATSLLSRLAGLPLPPVVQPPEVRQGIAPKVRLQIAPVAAHERERLGLLSARLSFDYDGLAFFSRDHRNPSLVARPPEPRVEPSAEPSAANAAPAAPATPAPSSHLLLHRDLDAEQAALQHLHALGLVGDANGRFHLPSSAKALQWVEWADADFAALGQEDWTIDTDPQLHDWIRRADTLDVQLRPGGQGSNPGLGDGDDSVSPWFDLSLGIEINGERHNILPLLPSLLLQLGSARDHHADSLDADADAESSTEDAALGKVRALPTYIYLPQADGRYLRLPTAPLRPWLQALLDLVDERGEHGLLDRDSLRLSRLEALRVGSALGAGAHWSGSERLRDMLQQLGGRSALPEIALPSGLLATLRPYQQHGLNWLQFLRSHGLAGILADDMGLGKTLQTLAHILVEKQAGRLDLPVLIIAPVSLMGNWRNETARFTPELSVLVLHGAQRHDFADAIAQHDVVIAPYSLLPRDRDRWLAQPWHLVVLDEAQNIKNANTHAAQIASELNTRHRLCLSGTPMENHLGELWSLFHFLMPGFLGSQARFKQLFRLPIEKHGDSERLDQLRRRVTPFMLRRTKRTVATDLPEKQDMLSRVTLQHKQADLYETIRLTTEKSVRDALATKGLAKSQIQVLDALLKLRQVCCDPRLLRVPAAQKVRQSAKLELLMQLLPEMLAEGRRVLLFSQFTSMLSLIEQELVKHKLSWVKLTGQSQNREALIEQFTSGAVPLFLISLKAGGVGLNLPQADTVIHYDPWWNPAVENQATDRAHRIGQTQRVMVYKLVAQGTIEERILALQERKAALADSMYSGSAARKQPLFSENDLQELLKPLDAH